MKNLTILNLSAAVCVCLLALTAGARAQVASGGNYTLTQTVIANGGASGSGASTNGNYSLEGTVGQTAVTSKQQAGAYDLQPGFWTYQSFAPSAASVSVTGRVITASGAGIRNVRVTMTGTSGEARVALSSSLGYFRFDGVTAGDTYVFSVSAKRFHFGQSTQVRSIADDTEDLLFTANEGN